jgi:CheY-like chemotaxis protein
LSELGYTVLLAENGADAVERFLRDPAAVDLLILDVVMPKLSGVATLARIEAVKPGMKALFISGHAPESERLSDQLRAPGRAFLAKPFSLADLATTVRELLDGGS